MNAFISFMLNEQRDRTIYFEMSARLMGSSYVCVRQPAALIRRPLNSVLNRAHGIALIDAFAHSRSECLPYE